MSNRERAIELINQADDSTVLYVISLLQSNNIPNKETIDAIAEVEEMITNHTGQSFEGSTEDFMKMILED